MKKLLLSILLGLALAAQATAQVPQPVTTGVPVILKGTASFANTSYGTDKSIGGLITIPTGLPPGTPISCLCDFLASIVTSNVTQGEPVSILFFDSNPTSSTFVDGQTASLNSADIPKVVAVSNSANFTLSQMGVSTLTFVPSPQRIIVGADGNLYFTMYSLINSFTFVSPGTIYWRFDRAQ